MTSQERGRPDIDIFVGLDIYPDALSVFSWQPKKLEEIKSRCLFVLDTNVLLLPYTTGSKSFHRIAATYAALARDCRLVVPGQVAREFAKWRATKLAQLHQQLADQKSKVIPPQSGKYPLLDSTDEFRRVKELEEDLKKRLHEYQSAVQDVMNLIRTWEWADPVITLYEQVFDERVVFDPEVDREEVAKDLKRRSANKIPPGFKDGSKDDLGIGDLLIWKTILDLGESRRQSVIFVSNDEKSDWWHRSGNTVLLPRHELVEEFRRASGGELFHMMKLSELLDVFEVEERVVVEVRKRESEQAVGQLEAAKKISYIHRDLEPVSRTQTEEEQEIIRALRSLGWEIGWIDRSLDSISIQLRDGVEARHFSGNDYLDAWRNAYSELMMEAWYDRPGP